MSKFDTVISVPVAKKVGAKRENVGTISIPAPSLKLIGFDVEPTKVNEDGTLVYEANEMQFLYNAIKTAVVTKAKNMLQPASVEFKNAGDAFADTLAAISAPAVNGGGNPEALNAIREVKQAFAAYLVESNLAAGAQTLLNGCFGSAKVLTAQGQAAKDKINARIEAFVEWAESQKPEVLNDYSIKYIGTLAEACQAPAVSLDDL